MDVQQVFRFPVHPSVFKLNRSGENILFHYEGSVLEPILVDAWNHNEQY